MTLLDTSTGRRRRPAPPGFEESVQQSDPPIYRDLIDRWTVEGRTLPGRRDPEWSRLTSSPVWPHGPLFADRP
ncbi:hypothetical protein [Streptomyces antimicrobicus]|uniref:Uncharacterized protein n=1 Tax=Streptomyces antimicrobicus TaxID=2883108 RepID=A0ABS8B7M9_9ACTN|nr:hypothetical protein [Streptomyces antimicrobicus]MCB5180618.1 hypothetical protein [Streptomyces antimicrobicus]